ncbi:transcriptional regulator [Amycolatopsis sp. SID8362]|nr:transcriptional regulator [Amycolatopsis sp. SID8362]NED44426.1 Rrf2 family transcriptional regulator [Amycolatopsis sp. SID8362]
MGKGVEAALHCCVIMHWLAGRPVTSAQLASFFGLPPAYLQKTLRALVSDGLAEATRGQSGGFVLRRPGERISLMDVVAAVEGREPAFQCEEIRLSGRSGELGHRPGQCAVSRAMGRAELSYRTALAGQSIADVAGEAGSRARDRTIAAFS